MRVFIIDKNKKRIGLILLLLMLAVAFTYPWTVGNASQKWVPIYQVNTQTKSVAITFDVAWGDEDLDDILQLLKQYRAKATFFVTGDFIRRLPDSAKKIAKQGHILGNHSDKHPHVAKLSKEALLKDTQNAEKEIEQITGEKSRFYRCPYGEYNQQLLETLSDYQVIQWNIDSRDWKEGNTAENIAKNVTAHLRPGSILLFHVGTKSKQTVPALREILKQIQNEYQCVGLDEMIPQEGYQIDANGVLSKS